VTVKKGAFMKRDLEKYIAEYERKFADREDYSNIYASDIMQMNYLDQTKGSSKYDLVNNCLTAGFMIGYKAAQKDMKKV
jgi:hypothetical protein